MTSGADEERLARALSLEVDYPGSIKAHERALAERPVAVQVEVEDRYDPENVLRFNQNIKPTGALATEPAEALPPSPRAGGDSGHMPPSPGTRESSPRPELP